MIGLIGGTGLGDALLGEGGGEEHWIDTPFGRPSAAIRLAKWGGVDLAILPRHGVGHVYNPSTVPYRANIYALKSLGVTDIIASGAVGSLREEYAPRDLVIPDQVIDKTVRRAPTFFDDGIVAHVEFSDPYCPVLRKRLLEVADQVDTNVHDGGTYVCMEGPMFSTKAESNLHRSWGAALIGMTTMPEAKLAREAEIGYGLVALVTDYDCWKPHPPGVTPQKLLEEIIGHLHAATANAVALIKAAVASIAAKPLEPSPCHDALKLAIWTDRAKVAPAHVKRYGVLVERHLRK